MLKKCIDIKPTGKKYGNHGMEANVRTPVIRITNL
jgi:hypothetical protein